MKKDILTPAQRRIVEQYRQTGRIAWLYPRLKRISLNGGRQMAIQDAICRMVEHLSG